MLWTCSTSDCSVIWVHFCFCYPLMETSTSSYFNNQHLGKQWFLNLHWLNQLSNEAFLKLFWLAIKLAWFCFIEISSFVHVHMHPSLGRAKVCVHTNFPMSHLCDYTGFIVHMHMHLLLVYFSLHSQTVKSVNLKMCCVKYSMQNISSYIWLPNAC